MEDEDKTRELQRLAATHETMVAERLDMQEQATTLRGSRQVATRNDSILLSNRQRDSANLTVCVFSFSLSLCLSLILSFLLARSVQDSVCCMVVCVARWCLLQLFAIPFRWYCTVCVCRSLCVPHR